MRLSEILCLLNPFWFIIYYLAGHNALRRQNIRLKMKLSDLALKTDNDIYAVYMVSDEDKDKIRGLKNQKNKIEAIKILKENYHMDLFEAKTYVDYL